ncbi:hypothetical protein DR950_41795 [Kitasatospora xanthocidica]|uniref:Uncharacterized protein n=1 Tax=Kitasatospora xanthocidica TaxID=83382 RepID=A0A372ZHT6_9ACTN|nr:hypothetical protein [Kitasatospora xanthocidica]RGD55399.1 hypothetical protein DR950_41795 [Kitasatospora xanthocidica]
MTNESEARGRVLLLAAAPHHSRHRLLDPEHGASALASVPAVRLLQGWTGPVDVVQLVDPGDPQAVLARLQEAAAAAGPLLVYVCGQLVRDRRQHRVHLALAKTAPATIRYTALPWTWLAQALTGRAPETTALVLDVIADQSCQPLEDDDLQLPGSVERYGVAAPPARRGPWQAPAYTVQLAQLLKTGPAGQRLADLHPVAAAQAGLAPGTTVLAPPPVEVEVPRPRLGAALLPPIPTRAPAPELVDLRPAIAEAMHSGHHQAAAELSAQWERGVLRTAGHQSPLMGDVLEVQATVAAAAGDVARAAERWTATAEHRLRLAGGEDQAVRLAARNALACWHQLPDEDGLAPLGERLAQVLQLLGRTTAAAAVAERATETAHRQGHGSVA